MFVQFNPSVHKTEILYENSSVKTTDGWVTSRIKVDIDHAIAAQTFWYYAVNTEEEELSAQAKGPGKGWHGPPEGTHGKTLSSIPGHVWERAAQRTGYKAVRNAIKALKANPVLPPSRDQQWHMPLKVGGELRGYLVGSDSFAQTVLGARMTPKSGSVEVTA